MKKLLVILCALILCAAGALAEGPAEPTVLETSDVIGQKTLYRLYDREFYEAEDAQPGTVVRIDYDTDAYGKSSHRWANVYLPYGYEENGTQRYPVIYFLHGNGGDPNTLIGNTQTKNAFDHMISTGIAEPFILVCPMYYSDLRKKTVDIERLASEIREDLMPLVEGTYRTYAETADEAGFIASRGMRAFCGFSRGSMTTWGLVDKLVDYSRFFMPFSGAAQDVSNITAMLDSGNEYAKDMFIYMASGGEIDTTYEGCIALATELAADTAHFTYGTDPQTCNFYLCLSDNEHRDLTSRYYLYNAFIDVLFK